MQNVHAGLHSTRPILITDVRMETTHENALLPWWPARMERCSEWNFLCVCGTHTPTYHTYTFSKSSFQPDLVTGISIIPVWWHTERKVCVGFTLPAGLPRTHCCSVRLTPFWLQTPQEQKEQPETREILIVKLVRVLKLKAVGNREQNS